MCQTVIITPSVIGSINRHARRNLESLECWRVQGALREPLRGALREPLRRALQKPLREPLQRTLRKTLGEAVKGTNKG